VSRDVATAADAVALREVEPRGWLAAVEAALAGGWTFAALYAGPGDGLRVVLVRGAEQLVLACATPDRRVASITGLTPAAVWDEREAHDLHGWSFDGHRPMRPLADHAVPTPGWTPAVAGRDVHQVAVGPIHAGIIESGHFRFHVVGERILHVELRLFYKHRGLEAAAAGATIPDGIAYVRRACAADAVSSTVAYAHACETALGLRPDRELRRARTLLLELERLWSHLNDISAICAGVGFAPGTMLFAALKERAQRLNARLTGHRFLFGTVAVGLSALTLDAGEAAAARAELRELGEEVARGVRELQFAGSLQARLAGVGAVTPGDVERLGGTGPAARAAGVAADVRTDAPRLWYSGFVPAVAEGGAGDVAARLEVRVAELPATLGVLDELLSRPLGPGAVQHTRPPGAPGPLGIGVLESPRGRTVCAVELDDDRIARLHLRTGSYANWPLLALAVRDELLPDFPLVNKSFELCYACVDR
jgi:Ni,Fe-hydrogenase III large subunit